MEYGAKYLNDIFNLAKNYQIYARIRDTAHYQMALRLRRQERFLGIPVIILTTIVGTAIFASLQNQAAVIWRIATGLLSVLAATLAALQTFFNFSGEAERHESVAVGYSQLRRQFDNFIVCHQADATTPAAAFSAWEVLLKEMDHLEQKAPRITNRVWELSKAELARVGEQR